MKKRFGVLAFALLVSAMPAMCADRSTSTPSNPAFDQLVDRIAAREVDYMKHLEKYAPLVETYVQLYSIDKSLGRVPRGDEYFLGRTSFKGGVVNETFLGQRAGTAAEAQGGLRNKLMKPFSRSLLARVPKLMPARQAWESAGFAQMAIIDSNGLSRQHYNFTFVRREFLGAIRCMVFDVKPVREAESGRFMGRIYVEDQGLNIVRFNGVFVSPKVRTAYTHFDSWRINAANGEWLPAYVYGEEAIDKVAFKAQTRFWGYSSSMKRAEGGFGSEFTAVVVDSGDSVKDQADEGGVMSPLASVHVWERQAEANIIEKLEKASVLAKPSQVDKVLETVTNNMIITNDLNVDPEIHCRVLLTAPIESFTVGRTIILSRGLLDVLPDEASLAAVLAHELSHIVLAHSVDTSFAFGDRLLFDESETIRRLSMAHTAEEEAEADKKSLELLANSPYKDKLQAIGLFLRQLSASHSVLPNLTRGRVGNSLVDGHSVRMMELMNKAPELAKDDITQTAALPLGARIELDPWSDSVEMTKAKTVAPTNAREKLPLLITPFILHLTRADTAPSANPVAEPASAPAQVVPPATEDESRPVHGGGL